MAYRVWFLLLALLLPTRALADITTGLQAYWSLNDGSGTTATDSNGHHGTLAGTTLPVWTAAGSCQPANGCLTFEGNSSYVTVLHDAALAITGDLTVAFWMYWDGTNGGAVITKEECVSNFRSPWSFSVQTGGGAHWQSYQHQDSGGFDSTLNFSALVPTTTWQHIAFTRVVSTKVITLYINGSLSQALTYGTDLPQDGGAPVLMAAHCGGGAGDAFGGRLNEVYIFSRALSAGDVLELSGLTVSAGRRAKGRIQ